MAVEHPTSLPKIRTFARDQAHVQHRTEPIIVVPEKVIEETIKIVEKKPVIVPVPNIIVSTTKKPLSATPPIHIPAFHELKNKNPLEVPKSAPISNSANQVSSIEKKITVRAKKFAEIKPTADGRIITDNKKGEFKVIPSMFTSFKAWLGELVGESKETPKYSVSYSDRRKGVIQKAASNTATIFTADSTALKEAVKRRQLKTVEKDELHITWTPNTESGVPLLEETTSKSASKMPLPIIKQREEYFVTPVRTETVIVGADSLPRRVFVPSPEITNFGKEPNLRALPRIKITEALHNTTPVTPLVIPEARPVAVIPAPLVALVERPILKISPIPNTPNPKTSHLKNGLRTIATYNTNLTAIIFAGSVVSLVLAVLIVRTFLTLISPTIENPDGAVFVPTLLEQGTAKDLALSSITTDAFYAALASEPVPASGVKEFRIVSADGLALSTQTVLALLNFNANQNLNQSVNSVHFAYAFSKRAIILEVTDATTVFGALLNWEDTMAEDLASALATGGLSGVPFTDKTIGQTDVRVLSESGTPVLVYGFIDKNVVVITQDLASFTALLPSTP